MGVLCLLLIMQWRLSNSFFRCLPDWQASSPDEPDLHINIHNFIALVINDLFMVMSFTNLHCQVSTILPDIDGWILLLEADNMSALIWMYRLYLMQEYQTVNLCHLFYHIIFYFNTMFPSRFDSQHIAGILDVEVDALSRPQDHPIYEKIFHRYPDMESLPAYCIPPMLIFAINACLSITSTKETLSDVTATLSSRKCNYFKLVAKNWASKTLL